MLFNCELSKDQRNGTIIVQKEATVGVNTNKIFQIRRQHNFPGPGLTKSVILHVKPILVELSEGTLLEKCLHGKTQNQNESFHGMIWQRVPKDVRVNAAAFEMGVYGTLSHINLENIATVNIYNYLWFSFWALYIIRLGL